MKHFSEHVLIFRGFIASNMAVVKLFENDDFIIINKPHDMYINSDNENEKNTVTCHIASHDSHLSGSSNPLYFVQRLDYSTSGILCIAKNKTAAARAGRLFEKRLTRKYYLAVLRGHVGFELADIHYAVGADPSPQSSHKMLPVVSSASISEEPRSAHTRLLVLETGSYCEDPVTVVLLKPITGRRHQLRVHCSAVGHTILGDYTYTDRVDSAPHRMFLHATRLILPFQQEPLDIQTPEPFFSDTEFSSKWKPGKGYYKYKTPEDFVTACDVIDRDYTVGIKYEEFCLKN
ncbi:RNA pseudouridylate synthase domain-containing protein 1-like [Bicyclus anynana]|uniref:RNA pseudouridylate synthase domain-containing protein 1-like n=1 Tax=Bicyclus anynana TaxID=110368 RepID=A0A6J1N1N8_BICAN|nr:RNA pseudouridylate synthase domain-containing protein 1-like [Bicyclus anynana]